MARGSSRSKVKWIIIAILSLSVFLLILYTASISGRKDNTKTNVSPYAKFGHKLQPKEYNFEFHSKATTFHQLRADLLDDQDRTANIFTRCSQLSQHEQLLDSECTAIWLNSLRNEEIIGVEKFWGFEDTHNGAITLRLKSGMRAMFKPCTSPSEDTTKEVIASYLDQLLSFGQTAPVITRKIAYSDLERLLISNKDLISLQDTIEKCGFEDEKTFIGPMIGWWDSLIPIRTVSKRDLDKPTLLDLRQTLSDNLLTAQMQSKYHTFYYLIYILRHGKDEFITKSGDLVSLDLDRSRYQSTTAPTHPTMNFTWCYTCYMDRSVYNTLLAVGPTQRPELRLSSLMKEMLSHDDIFTKLWDIRLANALDTRVEYLIDCIDHCIESLGESRVLLDEERWMTPRQLVEYFVTNSEYKNQNGKRGPSNLNLDELFADD